MNSSFDLAIIGGGIAGLGAASKMAGTGLKTLLLEARPRLGGRIFSKNFQGSYIEMGAEFVHSREGDLYELIQKLKISTYDSQGENLYHSQETGFQNLSYGAGKLVEKAFESLGDFSNDISVGEALSKIPQGKFSARDLQRIRNYIEAYHAVDIEQTSLKFILLETDEATSKLRAEYKSIIDHLEERALNSGVQIMKSCPVERISWAEDEVEIEITATPKKCILASRVLLTVPVSVLKNSNPSNRILFEPLLPKKKALEMLEMGIAERVTFVLKKNPFDKDFMVLYSEDELFNYWFNTIQSENYIVTAWVAGARANELSELSEEQVKKKAIGCLDRLSQKSTKDLIIKIFHHHWRLDPYSGGAYSYIRPGGLAAPGDLAKPIDKKLYFAGEATAEPNHIATVHGALQSGYRAFKEIIIDFQQPKKGVINKN